MTSINLLRRREALDISRAEMSRKTGISVLRLDRFEHGDLKELMPGEIDNICQVIASKSGIPVTQAMKLNLVKESMTSLAERTEREAAAANKSSNRYSWRS